MHQTGGQNRIVYQPTYLLLERRRSIVSPIMSSSNVANTGHAPVNTDALSSRGSGNVFADLGVANPDEATIKANLLIAIHDLIDRRGLSQTEAAMLMGVSQPDVSRLLKGRLAGYSLERLIGFARDLGGDIEIAVTTAPASRAGRVTLRVVLEHA